MTIDMEHYKTWEQYQQKYLHLKRKFLEISSIKINSEQLAALKELYSSVINSQRASDGIKNLAELVRVLENRAELSYNKIEPFKLISTNFVNNAVLSEILQIYELELKNQTPLPLFNVYKYQNGEYISATISENNIIHHLKKSSNEDIANSLEQTIIFPVESEKLLMPCDRQKISTDFHSTTSNHFYFTSENNKYKSIALYLSAAFVVVLCLLVPLIIVTIYVKSPESESASTRLHQQAPEISTHIVQFQTGSPSSPLPAISTVTASTPEHSVQIRVFQRLSDNLGRYWRDLARHLDVKESEIDTIDLKPHLTLKEKALQVLEIFRSRCVPSHWKMQLMRALHDIRRRDLAELVENLVSNE